MAFELRPIRVLRTILLSSAVLVGCASQLDDDEEQPSLLRHEHPPADAGTTRAPAKPLVVADAGVGATPVNCPPNTYDAIQTAIFDSSKYGCAQSFCHGDPAGHVDLRAGFSYDSLLGHVDHSGHDEGAHAHAEGETHAQVVTAAELAGFDVLHHEGEVHEDAGATGHDHGAHVIPGNPEASVLYDRLRAKVQGTQPVMGGVPMPLGPTPISKEELKAVELWIKAGAPRTGFVKGTEGVCPKRADAGR
jgi:hypothetical protein